MRNQWGFELYEKPIGSDFICKTNGALIFVCETYGVLNFSEDPACSLARELGGGGLRNELAGKTPASALKFSVTRMSKSFQCKTHPKGVRGIRI